MLVILRDRCVDHNMMEAVLDVDILMAASAYALKDRRQAKAFLEGALRFAEAEGYVRPFVDRAQIISPLLFEVAVHLSKTEGSSHAVKVAKACAVSLNKGITGRNLPQAGEDLTPREKETLGLMASGLRNKEIAETLFISLHTVKTHVRHILEKLDARTRVQAIQRAMEHRIQLS
jgi:DNA-binding CsgD family transcriptional regulator